MNEVQIGKLILFGFLFWWFFIREKKEKANTNTQVNSTPKVTASPIIGIKIVPKPQPTKHGEKVPDIQVTEEFRNAFEILENTSSHVFLTGRAGTGKSTFLDYFRNNTKKKVAVVAPTGVAAINVRGQTIHSFFAMPFGFIQPKAGQRARPDKRKLYKAIDVLIIDEISMVRADLLDAVEAFMRVNGKYEGRPFGGVQLCLIGDLYQLPPVVTQDDSEVYHKFYETPYFFGARCFNNQSFRLIELTKIFRQSEIEYINFLNDVREGSINDDALDSFNSKCLTEGECENTITLTSTNRIADITNIEHLKKLQSPLFKYIAVATGDFVNKTRELPGVSELTLRVGAQVMFTKNSKDKRWVNGTVGKVSKLTESEVWVDISSNTYQVPIEVWEKIRYEYDDLTETIKEKVIGSFKQFPLILAWAITIHKSQGKTFDKILVDLGNGAFAPGQTYVALSRCRTLNGLKLKAPLKMSDIINDNQITNFFNNYAKSQKAD